MPDKIKLYGFNNLTKTLSFNIYDVCYAKTERSKNEYVAYIDEHYDFVPTKFRNGKTVNEAGENNGSCKVFSFAKLKGLNEEETLALFGDFYKTDVLKNPEGSDHQNIRNFMQYGWDGIASEGQALAEKD